MAIDENDRDSGHFARLRIEGDRALSRGRSALRRISSAALAEKLSTSSRAPEISTRRVVRKADNGTFQG
ncbi:MAG: hypothetical protein U5R48_05400 [Gammaproteobacteria bacterium]|nr:hypothetical protein [Gammaproteobacteria bacterium]